MQKSLSKKLITFDKGLSPYINPQSTRPHRQLSQKDFLNSKNNKSISSLSRKHKQSPQRPMNSSFKILSPTKRLETPIQLIYNIISQENRLNSTEDVMRDILQKFEKCTQVSAEFKEEKIQKLLGHLKYYIGRMLIRIIECQKSRLNAINERYYKLAQSYEKQISEVKVKKENEFREVLIKHQGQLGRKLHERNLKCVFNSQLHNEMQSTGGLNLQSWIRGSYVLKNYIEQLQYNREKYLQSIEIDRLQSDPNIFHRQNSFDQIKSPLYSNKFEHQRKKEERVKVKIMGCKSEK